MEFKNKCSWTTISQGDTLISKVEYEDSEHMITISTKLIDAKEGTKISFYKEEIPYLIQALYYKFKEDENDT